MSIRIVRNDAGNCINFYGTSNPTYWNACLSATIDETYPDRINVRNDIRSQELGTDVYEFYQIEYTTFLDRDSNPFESPAEAAQYITEQANVHGDTGTFIFGETDTLDAQRETTNTTVLFSNGDIYAVNSLRAVDAPNGTITIRTIRADKDIYTNIRYYNVTVNGGAISFNTLNAAVDRLNEVLTGGTVGTDSGAVSGGALTTSNSVTFEVYGDRLTPTGSGSTLGYTSTAEAGNFDTSNGILSVESIDEAGEYFEFSQDSGNWTQATGLTFGLFDETTYDRSHLEVDEAGNAVKALLRLRINNSGFLFKDPASTYGRLNEAGLQNQLNTRTTFRVGLDSERRGFISMQLEDGTYQNVGRTEIAIAENTELKFVAIFPLANQMNGVRNMTVNTLTGGLALVWNYIESPDGQFYYPLFSTAEQANFVDEQYGTAASGAGASHEHIFPDEQPSVNTWYMPNTYMHHAQASAPTLAGVTYNEISTGADDAHAPADLTLNNQTFIENASVNLQIVPAGSDPATVTGLPSGLTYNNGFILGTTPYVPSNQSYTVTVLRSNAYGSTTQTFTISITDNASIGNIAGFTETQGNFVQPNRLILDYDALLQYDTQINPGEELTYSYNSSSGHPPTIGILNATGQANLDAFDPATDTLGTVNNANNFAQVNQWALRYVSFGGYIGSSSEKYNLVGWVDNTTIQGNEGDNFDVEFKLEYSDTDGLIRLYRNDALVLTSASAFVGAQTLTFAAFDDQAQTDVYIPTNLTITNSAAGTTTPPSGFVDPLETGVMNTQTLMGNGTDRAAVTVTQTLAINHRYIVPQAWIETNVLPYIAGGGANYNQDEQFYFGVPKGGVDWSAFDVNHFHAVFRIEGASGSNLSRVFYNNTSTGAVNIGSPTDAYYEYGIEWDGTTLHMIRCNTNDLNTTPSIADGGTFVSVQSMTVAEYAGQPLPLLMGVRNGGQINLTTSGLNHIRTPFGAQTILVGEASGGGSMFALAPAATVYDTISNGHASTSIGMSFTAPTLNAGSTYKFIYHPSLEADDDIKFTRIDDGTDYTTGVTFFGSGDPNFTDAYKGVTFAVPSDAPPLNVGYNNSYQGNTSYVLKELPISGSTYVTTVTGVTLEGPAANQTGTNIFDAGDFGWLSIDEQLGGGERLVMSAAFLADLVDAMPAGSEVKIGLKDALWSATTSDVNFEGALRLVISKGTSVTFRAWQGNTSTSLISTTVAGITSDSVAAFFDLTNSGNNIRFGIRSNTTNSTNTESSTPYADWDASYKIQTGDQGYGLTSVDVMVLGRDTTANAAMNSADVDWTALSEISVPTPGAGYTTDWTKALDFSGSAERALQVSSDSNRVPVKMNGTSAQVAAPASGNTVSVDTLGLLR